MSHFVRLAALVGLLAGMASAQISSAAVFPMQARGVDSNAVRIIEDALANDLLKSGKLRLLERSQMENILKEQGFQESGACDASECAVTVGKLLGIEKAVVGSLGLLGRTWVLNARLIDISTGEVLVTSQRSLTGEIDKALTELVPGVSADLTRTSRVAVKNAPESTRDEKVESSSSAWVWWTLGSVAVVGGGVAAALLLMGDDKGSDPAPSAFQPEQPADNTVPVKVSLP
jgi:hypothetical protein